MIITGVLIWYGRKHWRKKNNQLDDKTVQGSNPSYSRSAGIDNGQSDTTLQNLPPQQHPPQHHPPQHHPPQRTGTVLSNDTNSTAAHNQYRMSDVRSQYSGTMGPSPISNDFDNPIQHPVGIAGYGSQYSGR
jgi:hypothetical protein